MWHSGQVSQQYNNNQRTPLQQSHSYGQKDAAPPASSGNWGRTVVSTGPNVTNAAQQYTASSGLLLSAQYVPTVLPAVQISVSGMHQQPAQLTTALPQYQQSLQAFLPQQQYQSQAQPVQLFQQSGQQPWQAQQTWQPTQLQSHQHSQAARHIQHQPQHHTSQQQQQQQPQHLCQPQRQLQQQHPSQHSLAFPGSRGWGGQHLPYSNTGAPHEAPQPVPSQEPLARGGRGRGRERLPGYGRGYRGGGGHRNSGSGGSSTGFYSANVGSQTDALIHQLLVAVRQMPRGARTHEVVAGRLAGLDSRGIANLMKQLAASGLLGQAWDLFDWLRDLDPNHDLARFLDVFLYTAMISLCSAANSGSGYGVNSSSGPSGGGGGSRRDMDVALALSREMVDRGIPRNVHTFSALMNVCIKAGQHQAALEVWRELQEAGVRPSVVTYNTLIDAYGKTGQWAEALKIPIRMKEEGVEPVTRTFNTLMIACNLSNQWHEALAVYQQMIAAGHTPNTTTYNALITAYSKAGRLEKVMDALRDMEAAGCERTVITYSSLISACERDGRWELALQLFGRMLHEGCTPNVITFNSLITALAAGGQWERAADVFAEIQRQGCEPDVVTYTALINAYEKGAQWRRAIQAFEGMLRQGCRTDHVVFGAIVDALWDSGTGAAQSRAARIYCAAVAGGHVKPLVAQTLVSRTPVGASAGSVYASSAGLAAASGSGAAVVGGSGVGGCDVLELHLNALATGSAVVAFLAFLMDQRELVVESGPDAALPSRVILRFPRNRGARDSCPPALALRDALTAWLRTHGSPFKLLQDSAAPAALRFEAGGPDVGAWLLSDGATIALMPYPSGSGRRSGGGGGRDALADALAGADEERAQDEILETACREAFEEVRRFEASHCLSVATMGPAYLVRRRDLAANVLRVAAMLQRPYDVAHDAVQLLDRLMSAAPQLREDLLVMASVTALRMLAVGTASGGGDAGGGDSRCLQNVLRQPLQGSGSGASTSGGSLRGGGIHAQYEAELDARLAQVTGLPTLGFHSMELNILSALAGDTAAVSGLCCLRLLLRRLGAGVEALAAGKVLDVNPSGPSLRCLMDRALLDTEFLNYRPSATAAAALYCHRLRRGDTPPWPASLASLTGYNDLEHHPELAAAVGAIQRLLIEHSSSALPIGPRVGAAEASTAAAAQVAVFLSTN